MCDSKYSGMCVYTFITATATAYLLAVFPASRRNCYQQIISTGCRCAAVRPMCLPTVPCSCPRGGCPPGFPARGHARAVAPACSPHNAVAPPPNEALHEVEQAEAGHYQPTLSSMVTNQHPAVDGEKAGRRGRKPLPVQTGDQELVHEFWLVVIWDLCMIGLDLLTLWGAHVNVSGATITLGAEIMALQSGEERTHGSTSQAPMLARGVTALPLQARGTSVLPLLLALEPPTPPVPARGGPPHHCWQPWETLHHCCQSGESLHTTAANLRGLHTASGKQYSRVKVFP